MLMVCICSYLQSVLRYKFLILHTYHPDTIFTSARMWRFVLLFRNQNGSAAKKVWETLVHTILYGLTFHDNVICYIKYQSQCRYFTSIISSKSIRLFHHACCNHGHIKCGMGRTMDQAVCRLPPTAEARDRSRASPCGICGGQSGTGIGFSRSISVFPCQFHSTGAQLLVKGQKMARAVSRRPPTAERFVVDNVPMGQVFPRVLRVSPVSFIPPVLCY
jgi:hypothetical protein